MQVKSSDPLTKEDLTNLRSKLAPLLLAEARAKKLKEEVPAASLFVMICGVGVEFDSFELIDGFLSLRKVTNPPGIIHIARAANLKQSDYLSVGRYSLFAQAEISAGNTEVQEDTSFLLDMAWHTTALFKLRGYSTLYCPSVSSISWDTVSDIPDNSVIFRMLDDVPKQIRLPNDKATISLEDAQWVKATLRTALELRNFESSRRFGLAFNIMYSWNHTSDTRIAIASIWAGLEALFGSRDDRRTAEALAQRISDWLPSYDRRQVRDLYDQRCNAVHGRWLNEEKSLQAIKGSVDLLSQSLIKCVEKNAKTLPDWH